MVCAVYAVLGASYSKRTSAQIARRSTMPKRRMSTPRSRAASAKNLIKARAARHWPAPIKGSFGDTRRHKLGGKAYQKKTGNNFKVAAEATAILAGTAGFRNKATSDRESHDTMGTDYGHPAGAKVPKPKAAWAKKKPPGASADIMHGSGTGLSSHYRYLPVNVAARKRKAK